MCWHCNTSSLICQKNFWQSFWNVLNLCSNKVSIVSLHIVWQQALSIMAIGRNLLCWSQQIRAFWSQANHSNNCNILRSDQQSGLHWHLGMPSWLYAHCQTVLPEIVSLPLELWSPHRRGFLCHSQLTNPLCLGTPQAPVSLVLHAGQSFQQTSQ